jgi:hypothetical protein
MEREADLGQVLSSPSNDSGVATQLPLFPEIEGVVGRWLEWPYEFFGVSEDLATFCRLYRCWPNAHTYRRTPKKSDEYLT